MDRAAHAAAPPATPATPADADDDWDLPPPLRAPVVHLDGYDGPLDELLDLVERRRIAVQRLSAAALVDQVVAELARLANRTPLARGADWLLWTARLVLLRLRGLPPDVDPRPPSPAAPALRRAGRADDRRATRAAAAWLSARPQLGWDVFARPARLDPRVADYMDLMHACLRMQRIAARRRSPPAVDKPAGLVLWRPTDALALIRARLADASPPAALESFVPTFGPAVEVGPRHALRVRAAVANTLLAALELARAGEAAMMQDAPWGPVLVSAVEPTPPPEPVGGAC